MQLVAAVAVRTSSCYTFIKTVYEIDIEFEVIDWIATIGEDSAWIFNGAIDAQTTSGFCRRR